MATETELKLTGPPRALQTARRLPWLRDMACGKTKTEKLVSVYFDTPDCKLRRSGIALRIRRQGRKRLQTIKTEDGGDSAFSRCEWETEITGNLPDLRLAENTPLATLLNDNTSRSLRPVFETEIQRASMPLRIGESEVELSLDRGFVRAGKRRESVSEIELELKAGEICDLAVLAEKLADAVPVSYGATTKSGRGYALANGKPREPVEARDIQLETGQSVASAFTKIGLSCLHHLAGNEPAVIQGHSEGVHQMRVGLRRLRAAISVFKEIFAGPQTETIKTGLKWLTEELGPARDLHVLVEEGVAPLEAEQPEKRELQLLRSDLERRRQLGIEKAKAAVGSARYRKLVIEAAVWLLAGTWSRNEDLLVRAARERSIGEFARESLGERTKKVVKKSKKADELDAHGRHKLRIAVKKLRYSTEFFASLFAKKKQRKARERFEDILKTLQDSLGKLNDIAVHEKLAGEFVQLGACTRKKLREAYAMGLLSGAEQETIGTCVAEVKKTGKKLSGAAPYWQ